MKCEHRLEKSKMKSKVCCRFCYNKQYKKDNAEKCKQYYKNSAENIKQYKKQYYKNNAEKRKQYANQYRKDNPEYNKQFNKDNPEYQKQYRKNNAEKRKQYNKQYKKDNAENINQYLKHRRNSDPLFKMITNMRSRLYKYSKFKGDNKTWDLVGCSPIELREWLQCQFTEGMSWDNQGEWHIDHILPLCAAETTEDLKILAHFTNLQPLWEEDNLKKGGR